LPYYGMMEVLDYSSGGVDGKQMEPEFPLRMLATFVGEGLTCKLIPTCRTLSVVRLRRRNPSFDLVG
jgi:hypothetical protein